MQKSVMVGITAILVLLMATSWKTIIVTAQRNEAVPALTLDNRVYLPLVASSNAGPALGSSPQLGIETGEKSAQALQLVADAGAKWTRITLIWSTIEPTYTEPATYNFPDSVFQHLSNAGINPIVEIRGNPAWAATTYCGPVDINPDAFTRFLTALANRYGQAPYNVRNWELYNEPDNTDAVVWGVYLGGCWGNQPGQYVSMLQAASTAIKGVTPDAKIVMGGLAHESVPANFNVNFLDQVLAAGGADYFDVVNLHYFSSQNPTWESNGYDIAGKVGAVREEMARRGVSKPVAVTEVSWTSSSPTAIDIAERQAQYVPKIFARSAAIDLYAVTWFVLTDWKGADYPYGLLDVSHNPRPAYTAYQVAAAELGNARFLRRLTPTELGTDGAVEGYAFVTARGEMRWVLWAENSQAQIAIPSAALAAKDKLGVPIALSGNGPTIFHLDNSPIYVHLGSNWSAR